MDMAGWLGGWWAWLMEKVHPSDSLRKNRENEDTEGVCTVVDVYNFVTFPPSKLSRKVMDCHRFLVFQEIPTSKTAIFSGPCLKAQDVIPEATATGPVPSPRIIGNQVVGGPLEKNKQWSVDQLKISGKSVGMI